MPHRPVEDRDVDPGLKSVASRAPWPCPGSRVFAVLTVLLATSCVPTLKEYQGHRVFNPVYLFYLESSGRDQWQMPEEVLDALQLSEGAGVADIGAGGGYFTERLARRVGPAGHVYAVDVQPVMIRKLQQRVQKQRLTNVTVIHGRFEDPLLPPQSCDLAFFSSVYKEIDDRVNYLKRVRASLKEGGRVAILEYRVEARAPGPPRKSRLPEPQVIGELRAAGFRLEAQFDFLPREYFLVFGQDRPDPAAAPLAR